MTPLPMFLTIVTKQKWVLILFALLTFALSALSASFPANEYYALEVFFNTTGGDTWEWITPYTNLTGYPWEFRGVNVSNPCLEFWQGIVCSGDCVDIPCTVTSISLSSYLLTNDLPESLGDLSNLVHLDLSNNVLQGTIPEALAIDRLQYLNLAENFIVGSIPTAFFTIPQLQTLILTANRLTGSLPDTVVRRNACVLESLFLNKNQYLHGSLPTWLADCTNMSSFTVQYCQFGGTLPESYDRWQNIQLFDGSSNTFTGGIPNAWKTWQLVKTLNLDANRLSSTIPSFLSQLSHLETLQLQTNYLMGPLLDTWQNASSLRVFNVEGNKLTGSIPASIFASPFLSSLTLGDNFFTQSIPNVHIDTTELTSVVLIGNFLTGTVPEFLLSIPTLIYLQLSLNLLHGPILGTIPEGSQLNQLWLSDNALSGSLPTSIVNASKLFSLTIDTNQFTFAITEQFVASTSSVEYVYLSNNYLQGSLPDNFDEWSQLSVLNAVSNHFTGSLPATFLAPVPLSVVDLGSNHFTGKISTLNFSMATGLQSLFLYSNHFSGPLPSAFSTGIEELILFDNMLTGTIPASLSDLPYLRELALAQNAFHGEIVSLTSNLKSMLYLDVSHNDFTGPINVDYSPGYLVSSLALLDTSNNALTGSLPSSLNETSLRLLFCNSNQLTGTVNPNLKRVVSLQYLNLSANYLHGSMDTFLNAHGYYGFISLASNYFSGTINQVFRGMANLFILAINSNMLTGPINELVNPTVQEHLLKVDISGNALTGTIPDALFQSPSIQSVICASNCLTGSIPLTACSATNLTSLVLDGLHTSLACNQRIFPWVSSSVYTLSPGQHLDYAPSCLFALPQLTLLHLSGNAISGSLGSNLTISPTLLSLDLSHNAFTGPIPSALTSHYFDSMDLSFNQFTGVLPDDMVVASTTTQNQSTTVSYTSLRLQVNRLSGKIPPSVLSLPDVNILDGNMFACNNGDSTQLPVNDPKYESYECGSDSTNSVLIAWISLLTGIATLGVIVLQCWAPPQWSCRSVYEAVRSTRYFTTAPIILSLLAYDDGDRSTLSLPSPVRAQQMSPLHEQQVSTVVAGDDTNEPTSTTDATATTHKASEPPAMGSLLPLRALSVDPTKVSSDSYQPSPSMEFFHTPDPSSITTTPTLPMPKPSMTSRTMNHLHMLLWENQFLRLLIGLICVYACLVLVPVYSVLKVQYGTYTFQYAWDVAFAFLKGTTPLAVLLVFFFLLLALMFALAYQHTLIHDEFRLRLLAASDQDTPVDIRSSSFSSLTISTARLSSMVSSQMLRYYWRRIRQRCDQGLLWLIVLFVGNCGLVFVVNGAYVYAINQNYNRAMVEFISFLIGVFKLVWGNFVVLRLIEVWTRDLLSPTHQSLFLVVLSMFNNILAPYAAEAFVSPNCFEYSLIPPAPDTSTISTEACYLSSPTLSPENVSIICGPQVEKFVTLVSALSNPVTTVTFYPPFIYSYQCSSTLVSVFGGVFVVRYLLSGIVTPLMNGCMKAAQLYCLHRFGVGAWSFRMITSCLPILYRPVAYSSSSMNASAFQLINDDILLSIPRPLTLRKVYAVRVISDLAVLLTFGVLFPPLALVVGFSMLVEMITLEYGLGRIAELAVSDPRPQAQVRKLLLVLNDSFDGFGKGIWTFFPTLTVFCAVLWSFSFFDIASNEAGGVDTIWIIPVVSCLPLLLQFCVMLGDHWYWKGYCKGFQWGPMVSPTVTVSNVELSTRKTEDPTMV